MAAMSQNLKKVDVNSRCPDVSNGCHQWTTHEGVDHKNNRVFRTWCKACGAVPK